MFPSDSSFETKFSFGSPASPLPDEPPFHVLLIGDWSGDHNKGSLAERSLIEVDRDNFDEVVQRLSVEANIDLSGHGKKRINLKFNELDDFHPDNLFKSVSLFSELSELRSRLLHPDTFNNAAAEIRNWHSLESDLEQSIADRKISQSPSFENSSDLLDSILSGSINENEPVNIPSSNTDLGRFVSQITKPFLVKVDESEQSNLLSLIDATISDLMRSILHNSRFNEVESAWRGLSFLVKRIETNSQLKIFILDVSKEELLSNLKSVSNLADSFLYKIVLSENYSNEPFQPFSLIGGNFIFDVNIDDISCIMRIAKIAAAANSPFISYISPNSLFNVDFSPNFSSSNFVISKENSVEKLWSTLRSIEECEYIGFSPFRFLGRLPYGLETDPIESFDFQEFSAGEQNFLWLNPTFLIVYLLAKSFSLNGWEMKNFLERNVQRLPLYNYQSSDGNKTISCAEISLTESNLVQFLDYGLIPLISFLNTDLITVPRLQSVSSNNAEIKGRWF